MLVVPLRNHVVFGTLVFQFIFDVISLQRKKARKELFGRKAVVMFLLTRLYEIVQISRCFWTVDAVLSLLLAGPKAAEAQ